MALGAGCELAIFCDFVIAGESATFGQPEIKIGIFPPLAALFYPTVMGSRRATEMILLGENIDAKRAQSYGLISKVVPDERVADEVDNVATKLAGMSAAVLRTATRAVRIGVTSNFQSMLDQVESLYLNDLMSLEDSTEGVRAFLERRKPEWKNR
jgi:cyclohexa-1,5-dienecarbonyl-CoA hydratase